MKAEMTPLWGHRDFEGGVKRFQTKVCIHSKVLAAATQRGDSEKAVVCELTEERPESG